MGSREEKLFQKVRGHTENQNAGPKPGGKAEALTPHRESS